MGCRSRLSAAQGGLVGGINKVDLLPHLDFDVHKAIKNALAVNPNITTYRLSARSGEGLVARYN